MTARYLLGLVLALWTGASLTQEQPPNIIVIMADDLGWDDVSFHGSAQIPTPNLDALAADGIVLHNYYSHDVCTPSRAAFLTGMYPVRLGLQHSAIGFAEPWGLPLNVKIMPQFFKELGYETHLIGKWHLGYFTKLLTPTYRGYDTFYGYHNAQEDYYNHTLRVDNHSGVDFWLGSQPLRNETGRYSTVLFTERAIDLIRRRNKRKPFFLHLSHQAPHGGSEIALQAPKRNVAKFSYIGEQNRTIYAAMVDAMDESVGAVVEALHEAGMLNRSIVVFIADNGGSPWGEYSSRAFNWPLRGAKHTLWEGGCRTAALLWSPLLVGRRRVSRQLMHVSDWLPTLYGAAGGHPALLSHQMDGLDMWRHLSLGLPSPRTEVLYNIDPIEGTAALRYHDYKLVLGVFGEGAYDDRYPTTGGSRPSADLDRLMTSSRVASVLRKFYNTEALQFSRTWRHAATVWCGTGRSSISNFVRGEPPYLFNIAKDPCELRNLAAAKTEMVATLKRRLHRYAALSVTPSYQPSDSRGYPENLNGTWAPWL